MGAVDNRANVNVGQRRDRPAPATVSVESAILEW